MAHKIASVFILTGSVLVAAPAFAATTVPSTPPASRCITATSKAMYASALALEKKDIAPYLDKEGMKPAIDVYEQNINTAWSAMGDPYCGFGDFGAKSAIHSFQKTTERVRLAFLDQVAQFRKTGSVSVVAPVATPEPTSTEPSEPAEPSEAVVAAPVMNEAPKPTPVVKAATVASHAIPRGLHEGMRSDEVLHLQKVLATVLGFPMDDPYITGYFGRMTKERVIKFQKTHEIIDADNAPGAGLIGPRTAAALNKLP